MKRNVPDNYEKWLEHEAMLAEMAKRLPICDYCGEPIFDESYFFIHGETICRKCLKYEFERPTEDFEI